MVYSSGAEVCTCSSSPSCFLQYKGSLHCSLAQAETQPLYGDLVSSPTVALGTIEKWPGVHNGNGSSGHEGSIKYQRNSKPMKSMGIESIVTPARPTDVPSSHVALFSFRLFMLCYASLAFW